MAPDMAHRDGGLGSVGVQAAGLLDGVEARPEQLGAAEVGTIEGSARWVFCRTTLRHLFDEGMMKAEKS
jgi:hypothetical protein